MYQKLIMHLSVLNLLVSNLILASDSDTRCWQLAVTNQQHLPHSVPFKLSPSMAD